jgi:hypothetical protein
MPSKIFNAILPYSRAQTSREAATEWVLQGAMTVPIACICICGQPHKWMNVWNNVVTGQRVPVGCVCSKNLETAIERLLAYEDRHPDSRHVRAGYRRDDFVVEDNEGNESEYEYESEEDSEDEKYEEKYQDTDLEFKNNETEYKILKDDADLDSYEWNYKSILDVGDDNSLLSWWPIKCSAFMLLKLRIKFASMIERYSKLSDGQYLVEWMPTRTNNENIIV